MKSRHIDVGAGPWKGGPPLWDGYRFGSETCPILVPRADGLRRLAAGIPPDRLTLVTALAPPDALEEGIGAAAAAIDAGWGEVVVNDWGLLHSLSERGAGRLTAGRLLMRFRRGPGDADPWDGLDEEARRYFAWGPLYDGAFLDVLRDMGVRRVEADLPRRPMAVPPVADLSISLHVQSRLVSVAASCPWLFDPGTGSWSPSAACTRVCERTGGVLLYAGPLAHPLVVRGRSILEDVVPTGIDENLPPWVDRLIYEGRSMAR